MNSPPSLQVIRHGEGFAPAVQLGLAFAFLFSIQGIDAQSSLWQNVKVAPSRTRLAPAEPLERPRRLIAQVLKARMAVSHGWCAANVDPADTWLTNLRYSKIPVAARREVLLVEAGEGCARGGQGSNGAMWLIRFDGGKPTLLASPEDDFGGWLYSVQPTQSHGYRDVVLGWHMSAREAPLCYFRYDGKSYHLIGTAILRGDENGNETIVPDPRPMKNH